MHEIELPKLSPELSAHLTAYLPTWAELTKLCPSSSNGVASRGRDREQRPDQEAVVARAIAYLQTLPPAIQGQRGSDATMNAARSICWGFDLGESLGFDIIAEHYNPRCVPPWSESELQRKCREACDGSGFKKPRGWLLDESKKNGKPHSKNGTNGTTTNIPKPKQSRDSLRGEFLSVDPSPSASKPEPVGQEVVEGTPINPAPTVSPTAITPTPLPTPSSTPKPFTLRNHGVHPTENGGEIKIGIPAQRIAEDLLRFTGGWPKRVGASLFVPTEDYQPRWLDDSTSLFAWIWQKVGATGGVVDWARQTDMVSKGEFYQFLLSQVDQFDDLQLCPHHPPRPKTYYLHPGLPEPIRTEKNRFDELLEFFSPSTDIDAKLLRAFFLTTIWGGPEGRRPLFLLEAAHGTDGPGQGIGKTTVALTAAKIVGGYISFDLTAEATKDLAPRLLSSQGRKIRFALFDNVKGTRISSSIIESFITSPDISGRALYEGEGTRPNLLTWAMTSNQPALSKDLTQRSIPIRLCRPHYTADWGTRLDAFISANRWGIISDMILELQLPSEIMQRDESSQKSANSRWAEWEHHVLSKVCEPSEVFAATVARREELDDDDATTEMVREAIASFIRDRRGYDPESVKLILPPSVLHEAIGKVSPFTNLVATLRWLSAIHVRGLERKRTEYKRFWLWSGKNAAELEAIEWDVIGL